MKVDVGIGHQLAKIPDTVRRMEAAGYDGVRTAEMNHDPFFPLLLAAEHSEKLDLATSIAVAFARSPMNLANIGHDLNAYSRGRFTLGLGSQIKPHITKRFTPEDREYGAPRVVLAAVGPAMTEVAGEVADGMIIHPFSNIPYINSVTMPAIEAGLAKAGRKREDFELSYSCFVVTGRDEQEFAASKKAAQERIAFYGSTPAYKGVLDAIGCGDLQAELNTMSKQGRWKEMGTLITDEMLHEFGVMGEPHEIAPQMLERYGSFVDRTSASFPVSDEAQRAEIIRTLRAG